MTESTARSDVTQFKQLESAAGTGNHAAEAKLSNFVFDTMKSDPRTMTSIAHQLQQEGQQVKFDKNGGFLSIDDGHVAVFKQNDGDIASVKRNAQGQVDDVAFKDGTFSTFNRGANGQVESMTQHIPGRPDQTLNSTPEQTLSVDHDGSWKLTGKRDILSGDSPSVESKITGEEVVKDKSGYTTVASQHGDLNSPDSVTYDGGSERRFSYSSDGQVIGFKEPGIYGASFTRGNTAYSDGGHQYYEWKGTDGSKFTGSLEFAPPKNTTIAAELNIRSVGGDGMLGPVHELNVMKSSRSITDN